MKKLGVGLIVYNQEDIVLETLNSIVNQSFKEFDLYISDDNSEDQTHQVIKDFIEKKKIEFQLFKQDKNLGVTKNSNFLYKIIQPKYEYMVIFAGDDIMHKSKFEMQLRELEKNKKASFCYTDCYWFHQKFKKLKVSHFNFLQKRPKSINDLISDFSVPTPTIMYRSSILNPNGFDERIESLSDISLVIDLWNKGEPCYIDKALTYYRRHKKSRMMSNDIIVERKTLKKLILEKNIDNSMSSIEDFDKLITYSKISSDLRNNASASYKDVFRLSKMIFKSNKWTLRIIYIYLLVLKKIFFKN